MCVPQAYGGLELPPADTMYTIETPRRPTALGVVRVVIGATSAPCRAVPPTRLAHLHGPEVLLGGVFAPRGKAVAEPGGFRVNGRWQWVRAPRTRTG